MHVVPKARGTDPGVIQDKLVDAVCAKLRAEGGAEQKSTTQVDLSVSWFQRPLACSILLALLVNQFRRKMVTTGEIRSEWQINYVTLEFASFGSLLSVLTHVQEEFLVWSLDKAADWTGRRYRSDDNYSYRLKVRAAAQVWRFVGEALPYVVSVARDGAVSAAISASRADTALFAPVRSAAGAAGEVAPTEAPTMGSELSEVLSLRLPRPFACR